VPRYDSFGRPGLRLGRSVTMTTRSLALNLFVFLIVASAARAQPDAEQVYVLTGPERTMEQVIGRILAAHLSPPLPAK
jgi:hypothetical protein